MFFNGDSNVGNGWADKPGQILPAKPNKSCKFEEGYRCPPSALVKAGTKAYHLDAM
jgi:hypothetical protein